MADDAESCAYHHFESVSTVVYKFFGLEQIHHQLGPIIDNFQQPFFSNERKLLNLPAKRLFLVQILIFLKLWKTIFCAQ